MAKFDNTWAVTEDTEKPKDERIKSGKYIKHDNNVKPNCYIVYDVDYGLEVQ